MNKKVIIGIVAVVLVGAGIFSLKPKSGNTPNNQNPQEQLAEKIGVSRQTVSTIESGKYLPSLGLAFKIADLFKVQVENLFLKGVTIDES